MEKAEKRPDTLSRDFCIRQMEGEGNERRFSLSFSSEEPYERWWGVEILDHSEGAADLTRLSEIGCVLYNHNRDKVIGKITEVAVKDGRGEAVIEIDEDAESEVIYQKMKSGTLKGISVGYIVNSWEEVAAGKQSGDGKYTGPCSIARSWEPYEISIVSIPADITVGIGRSRENTQGAIGIYERQLVINRNLYASKGGKNEKKRIGNEVAAGNR